VQAVPLPTPRCEEAKRAGEECLLGMPEQKSALTMWHVSKLQMRSRIFRGGDEEDESANKQVKHSYAAAPEKPKEQIAIEIKSEKVGEAPESQQGEGAAALQTTLRLCKQMIEEERASAAVAQELKIDEATNDVEAVATKVTETLQRAEKSAKDVLEYLQGETDRLADAVNSTQAKLAAGLKQAEEDCAAATKKAEEERLAAEAAARTAEDIYMAAARKAEEKWLAAEAAAKAEEERIAAERRVREKEQELLTQTLAAEKAAKDAEEERIATEKKAREAPCPLIVAAEKMAEELKQKLQQDRSVAEATEEKMKHMVEKTAEEARLFAEASARDIEREPIAVEKEGKDWLPTEVEDAIQKASMLRQTTEEREHEERMAFLFTCLKAEERVAAEISRKQASHAARRHKSKQGRLLAVACAKAAAEAQCMGIERMTSGLKSEPEESITFMEGLQSRSDLQSEQTAAAFEVASSVDTTDTQFVDLDWAGTPAGDLDSAGTQFPAKFNIYLGKQDVAGLAPKSASPGGGQADACSWGYAAGEVKQQTPRWLKCFVGA